MALEVCTTAAASDGGAVKFSSRQGVCGSRLHVNLHGLRVDSIGDYDQLVVARGYRARHVEVSLSELFSCGHGHRMAG